ncbi:MAG: PIN domain-containing protein [Rhodanobacter sp.]|nr:MAG: PIN domain-containing protein [Rhodanobacter sp.]TAL90293.1 MAG: PIN domain-containing protein [Rhodanobacter sp.]TAM40337.1 MAG: PIN domain-containing protein [Rhodanobacter sp.]
MVARRAASALTVRVFIDTNLWVYRLDQREVDKSRWIGQWLRQIANEHEIVISTQVLIELRAVLTRKFEPALSAQETRVALHALAQFEVVATDANLVLDANELANAEQLSWFDALIAEAALRTRCEILYSEDFSHGRTFGELAICNPLLEMQGKAQ